jgi:hypothetical protein
MRNLELHTFETDTDIDEAIQSGLLEPNSFRQTECLSCNAPVGFIDELGFIPFVYVIDDEDREWFICLECAEPVLLGLSSEVVFKPLTPMSQLLEDELIDFNDI